MKIIIALGGNALIKKNEKETYSNLLKNIQNSCKCILKLIKNNKVVITFGNGPEVGNLLLQNEISKKHVPEMPLDILNAETEGLIGYLLQEQLGNELRRNKMKKHIATLITQTLVSKKDKAFHNPTKFIGPFYTEKQIKNLNFKVKKDSNRGFRRVVPSPKPIKIIEEKIINKLVEQNYIVIANGGGGIPVILENNKLNGVEAVVDKDLSSACLGNSINADLFLILTDVDKVYLNYGTKNQKGLSKLTIEEAKKYLKEGQFPDGSMGPKILAGINFLDKPFKKSLKGKTKRKFRGKKLVIITNIENVDKALKMKAGTIVTTM